MASERIDYLATDEDGRYWLSRAGVGHYRALTESQRLTGEPWWRFRARKTWMRPAVAPHDCPVANELHNVADLDHEPPDGCRCREFIDDGYMLVCAESNSAAIAAWEVEYANLLMPWAIPPAPACDASA